MKKHRAAYKQQRESEKNECPESSADQSFV
jgi:hypothetical protein